LIDEEALPKACFNPNFLTETADVNLPQNPTIELTPYAFAQIDFPFQ